MEIILRVVATYFIILIGLRVLGKRELNQLSAIELVTLMLVPEIVSQALAGQESMLLAFVGICTLFILVYLTSVAGYLWKPVSDFIEGKPHMIKDKKGLNLEILDKERISVDELLSEVRQAGYERLDQIESIILEPDGKISLIPKAKTSGIDQQMGEEDNL